MYRIALHELYMYVMNTLYTKIADNVIGVIPQLLNHLLANLRVDDLIQSTGLNPFERFDVCR